jgi:hypothetical protein
MTILGSPRSAAPVATVSYSSRAGGNSFRAASDGGEQLVHLRLGQPDPAVMDPEHAVIGGLRRFDRHVRRRVGIERVAGRDRIDGVLDQLPDIDPQVHLERMFHQQFPVLDGNVRPDIVGSCTGGVGQTRSLRRTRSTAGHADGTVSSVR